MGEEVKGKGGLGSAEPGRHGDISVLFPFCCCHCQQHHLHHQGPCHRPLPCGMPPPPHLSHHPSAPTPAPHCPHGPTSPLESHCPCCCSALPIICLCQTRPSVSVSLWGRLLLLFCLPVSLHLFHNPSTKAWLGRVDQLSVSCFDSTLFSLHPDPPQFCQTDVTAMGSQLKQVPALGGTQPASGHLGGICNLSWAHIQEPLCLLSPVKSLLRLPFKMLIFCCV